MTINQFLTAILYLHPANPRGTYYPVSFVFNPHYSFHLVTDLPRMRRFYHTPGFIETNQAREPGSTRGLTHRAIRSQSHGRSRPELPHSSSSPAQPPMQARRRSRSP